MRSLFLILLASFLVGQSYAQGYFWQSGEKKKFYKYLTVEGGIGTRMYFGDVQPRGQLFNKINFAYHVGARYQWKPHFGFALQLGGRGYRGLKEFSYPGSQATMDGKLWEGNLVFQFNWLRWEDFNVRQFTDRDPVRKLNAFVGAGAGGALFNASYNSNYVSSADTIIANYESNSAGGFAFYVPVVVGFRYRFDPSWSLGLEFQYHIYFSDNIDAVQRQKQDRMGLVALKLGYSFGQNKKKANIGMTPNQKRRLKK